MCRKGEEKEFHILLFLLKVVMVPLVSAEVGSEQTTSPSQGWIQMNQTTIHTHIYRDDYTDNKKSKSMFSDCVCVRVGCVCVGVRGWGGRVWGGISHAQVNVHWESVLVHLSNSGRKIQHKDDQVKEELFQRIKLVNPFSWFSLISPISVLIAMMQIYTSNLFNVILKVSCFFLRSLTAEVNDVQII